MVNKGDDEKFRGLKVARNYFQCVCGLVDFYVGFVGLHFMREHPDFWELRRTAIVHWSHGVNHTKEDCGSF